MRQNKKGDVPITILVVGVFALCTLALITFYFAEIKIQNAFSGLNVAENVNSIAEQLNFYKKNNPDEINQIASDNGDYYSIIQEYNISEGVLFWKKDVVLLNIEYRVAK